MYDIMDIYMLHFGTEPNIRGTEPNSFYMLQWPMVPDHGVQYKEYPSIMEECARMD